MNARKRNTRDKFFSITIPVTAGILFRMISKEEKKKNTIVCVLAALGTVLAVGLSVYFIYKKMTEKTYDDFEDDFDDDFEDDFFEDEDEDESDLL